MLLLKQFELEDRISKDFSDLKIKLVSLSSAKYIESLVKTHQFTGRNNYIYFFI